MSRLFRTLCVSLCAALVAVLSLHGVQEGRHQIAHASDWPAVMIEHNDHAEIVDVDHGSPHIHVARDAPAENPLDQAEGADRDGDAGRPASHHHHSSGDNHTAIPLLNRDLSPLVGMNAMLLQPAVDGARPAHDNDGPEYPPRRTRTII
ncbi:hypothetical protein BH09PSE1_BH09PSE1_02030 [soil metagenome]